MSNSRVIKFRAWHNGAKAMLHVGDSHGTTHPLDCCAYAKQGQDIILMQFTGLLDKNGKEIYEGDIVMNDSTVMQIMWFEKFSCFCLTSNKWLYPHFFGEAANPEDCEVIGNIYENPELLKP